MKALLRSVHLPLLLSLVCSPALSVGQTKIDVPSWMNWPSHAPDPKIVRHPSGAYGWQLNFNQLKNSGGASYYVDPAVGSDSNIGTSSLPLKTLSAAIAKSDVGTVYLRRGVYYGSEGFNGQFLTKSINIVASNAGSGGWEDEVVLGSHKPMAWTPLEGFPNVWKAAAGNAEGDAIHRVVDLRAPRDSEGVPVPMVRLASPSEVDAVPGSWSFADGVLYVNRTGGIAPDRTLVPTVAPGGGIRIGRAASVKVFLRGINAVGGNYTFLAETNAPGQSVTAIVDGGWFIGGGRVSDGTDVVTSQGASLVLKGIKAAYGNKDGINLHWKDGNRGYLLELGCKSYYNGLIPIQSCNGSSVHDGSPGIRVNSVYYGNRGGNLADIDAGTTTFNVGIFAHHSQGDGATAAFHSDFVVLAGVRAQFLGCKSEGSNFSLTVSAGAYAILRDCIFPGPWAISSTATVETL